MQEIEINIKSDIFSNMLKDVDNHIQQCLDELSAEKFESGDISIKISIETINAEEELHKIDKEGIFASAALEYTIPKITYKTSLVLKQKHDTDGMYFNRDMQLIDKNGKYIAQRVKGSQINLNDILGNEN